MSHMHAGWSQADITPSVGIHMGGYWGRTSGATGVHDELTSRLILWRSGVTAASPGAILVALDLVAVTASWVAELRAEIAMAVTDQVAVDVDAITVCCTHTHAGPLSLPFRGMGEVDPDYLQTVRRQIVQAARAAAQSLAPVQLRYGLATTQIGINRRQGRPGQVVIGENPAGPVATHAHVLVMEGASGRAVLFQHACHPVVLGNTNHELSADFPGPARRTVEERVGGLAVFVNGAAGDINPRLTTGSFADVETLGSELGVAVADAAEGAEAVADPGIAYDRRCLHLPLMEPPPATRAAVESAVQELKTAIRTAAADEWQRRVPQAQLDWSRDLLRLARDPSSPRTQGFEIHGMRVGGVILLGMEGEILVRYQLDFEAQADVPLILCGYANGCIGYVPTADEYARGGYEVDQAYKVYPGVLMIAPESDALIREVAADVLAGLGATGR